MASTALRAVIKMGIALLKHAFQNVSKYPLKYTKDSSIVGITETLDAVAEAVNWNTTNMKSNLQLVSFSYIYDVTLAGGRKLATVVFTTVSKTIWNYIYMSASSGEITNAGTEKQLTASNNIITFDFETRSGADTNHCITWYYYNE